MILLAVVIMLHTLMLSRLQFMCIRTRTGIFKYVFGHSDIY